MTTFPADECVVVNKRTLTKERTCFMPLSDCHNHQHTKPDQLRESVTPHSVIHVTPSRTGEQRR
ncbi:hypothetical protein E2C01_002793 [Portunus trituberculatus]|uniref:Uncharacterized protein n=1 Tax=Portunus trituberculatus TaxID=210409 RepID=A0A5B7CNG0_PORTR|nr:hypothetical protein [Portunus trituberculatus]